ncbi:MAG: NADH-quinone oxidoreductase subunit J family protein [Methanobacteriota archaeon]
MVAWDLVVFVALSAGMLAAAIKAVVAKELIHSTVWLTLVLFGVAVLFLMLGAQFLATVQILVYVGAVITLILFTLMLVAPAVTPSAPVGPRPVEDSSQPVGETRTLSPEEIEAVKKKRAAAGHKPGAGE